MCRVLLKMMIVEDEMMIVEVLKSYFEKEGFIVYYATNGADGLHLIKQIQPDFIILDLMLPDIIGEEICREVRKESDVPIIILTAKVAEEDRINGIEMGADDYIVKPFSPREVVVRVKAVLRRINGNVIKEVLLSFNDQKLLIDTQYQKVIIQGEEVKLTPIEYKLLFELAKEPGRVFSRLDLLKIVQPDCCFYEGYERGIDVHIKNLRKKVEWHKEPKWILTVYGMGYKFGGQMDVKNSAI